MTTKYKTYLAFFIASMLIPYLTVIFLGRNSSFIISIPLFPSALVLLIVSTIKLRKVDTIKSRKKYYWLIAIAAVFFFFYSYNLQLDAANWVFFKLRERKLTLFVSEIKKYKKIKEMSDGQRFWKTINNTPVEPKIKEAKPIINEADTIGESTVKKYVLEDILQKEGIDKTHYEFFRQILISTDIESFTTLDDGTISYTIDGFLNNCFGIAYSEKGTKPENNDCGQIAYWTKITDNWYGWGTK